MCAMSQVAEASLMHATVFLQVTSNWRPLDTSDLSEAFRSQPRTFSWTLLKKPNAVIIRPKVRALCVSPVVISDCASSFNLPSVVTFLIVHSLDMQRSG